MEDNTKSKRRRALFLLAGFAAFAAASRGAYRVADWMNSGFDFVELTEPTGFRKLASGEMSSAFDPFVGLGGGGPEFPAADISNFDEALFYNRRGADRLQLAYFSDLYCPYCRVLSSRILALNEGIDFDISWHETPLFGEASVLSAKAHIAAGRQMAYAPFHKRLIRTPVQVTYPFLERVAESQGLDLERFEADFNSDQTLRDLGRSQALANAFGLIGTPALVVGHTLVVGQISETNLRQLIDLEIAEIT